MLRNYFKVAVRNIRRNKLYASLNILGLGVGLASFFIIYLFLQNEQSYDQFHTQKDRVYRVLEETSLGTNTNVSSGLTSELAPVAAAQIPEIEAYSRLENFKKTVILPGRIDSVHTFESLTVEKGFLKFFDLDFTKGSASNSFQSPDGVLISQSKEQTLFGGDALGKIIKIWRKPYRIEGVFADIPHNSSLKADLILPYNTLYGYRSKREPRWNVNYGNQTFFLLSEGASIATLEKKLNEIREANSMLSQQKWRLQSINEIHFSLGLQDSIGEKTDAQYISIFTIVAIFILLCAVFNYISLALSQSIERTKEIGVRKVVGAANRQLYTQFISESILFVLAGFVVALILVEVMLPQLEALLGRTLSNDFSRTPELLVLGLLFSLVVAGLSALYPAYISAAQKVAGILKGGRGRFKSHNLVGAISVFQIGVFMVLVSVAFTANRQMHFMQNEHLGFDKENQLVIPVDQYSDRNIVELLKNEFVQIPSIVSSGFSTSIPTQISGSQRFSGHDFTFVNFDIDEGYLETMGMELKEGRNFLPEDSDSANLILINEAAVKKLNMEGSVVGRLMKAGQEEFRILGVVSDFHWLSKREEIGPILFRKSPHTQGVLVVKLQTANLIKTMDQIKGAYSAVTDRKQIDFFFLDEKVDAQYRQEGIMITMINTFAIVAAFVAFIGLFGIAGYSARRRLKEMGIRKVLGAGFMSIQLVLNRINVSKLAIAALIAVPLIVYWMENWLNAYAYRIELPVSLILGALCIASMVILFTAMFHSIRVFLINPIDILKDE